MKKEEENLMNDAHLFKIARECSLKADYSGCGRARIGCVVVYNGSILAKGCNSDKTHTEQAKYNQWRFKDCGNRYLPSKTHAEIATLNRIKYLDIDMSRVYVYIYRETRNGHLAMCRPCNACMAAIRQMGIKHILYTTDDGYAHEVLKNNI